MNEIKIFLCDLNKGKERPRIYNYKLVCIHKLSYLLWLQFWLNNTSSDIHYCSIPLNHSIWMYKNSSIFIHKYIVALIAIICKKKNSLWIIDDNTSKSRWDTFNELYFRHIFAHSLYTTADVCTCASCVAAL